MDEALRCPECGLLNPAFTAMSEAVLSIASELAVEPTLQKLVDAARELVDARYAALGVPDGSGGFAQFLTSGMTQKQYDAIGELPRQHGLLGAMLETQEPYQADDIQRALADRGIGSPARRRGSGASEGSDPDGSAPGRRRDAGDAIPDLRAPPGRAGAGRPRLHAREARRRAPAGVPQGHRSRRRARVPASALDRERAVPDRAGGDHERAQALGGGEARGADRHARRTREGRRLRLRSRIRRGRSKASLPEARADLDERARGGSGRHARHRVEARERHDRHTGGAA